MGKLKKIAESGQLWEPISLQFFAENTQNLAQCCIHSPRISEKFCFENTEEEMGEKAKNMLLLFGKVKLGVKKLSW